MTKRIPKIHIARHTDRNGKDWVFPMCFNGREFKKLLYGPSPDFSTCKTCRKLYGLPEEE